MTEADIYFYGVISIIGVLLVAILLLSWHIDASDKKIVRQRKALKKVYKDFVNFKFETHKWTTRTAVLENKVNRSLFIQKEGMCIKTVDILLKGYFKTLSSNRLAEILIDLEEEDNQPELVNFVRSIIRINQEETIKSKKEENAAKPKKKKVVKKKAKKKTVKKKVVKKK